MKVVQYNGLAHIRKLSKSDFANVGVEDQGAITVDRRDRLTKGQVVVSDLAAEYLTNHDSFVEITNEQDMGIPVRTAFRKETGAAERVPEGDPKPEAKGAKA